MKKFSKLICVALIGISHYSNTNANDWNNFMNQFNTNNVDNNTGNTNNYSVGQCNVNQSELDDVDNFINDYMMENPPTVQDQGIPNNPYTTDDNKDRKLSYDVSNKKYNALQNYQKNNKNTKSRPSTAEKYYDEFNNNNQILQNVYIPHENIIVNQMPQQGNIVFNNKIPSGNTKRKYTIDAVNKPKPEMMILNTGNTKDTPVGNMQPIQNNRVNIHKYNSNTIDIKQKKMPQVQYNKNNLNIIPEMQLTDEQLIQLLSNGSPDIDTIPTVNNTIKLDNNPQIINNNLNNNKTPIDNKAQNVQNYARGKNNVQKNIGQCLTERNNRKQNVSPIAVHHQRTGVVNIKTIPVNTPYNKIGENINEIQTTNQNKQIIKPTNIEKITPRQPPLIAYNQNNADRIISTHWEKGITQEEVNLFFQNINDSNAFENVKLQIYSLLGDIAPAFGDPDRIRLLFDVLKKSNKKEKHIYNYEKPIALTCVFLDYYLNNIDLHNTDKEQFKIKGIDYARHVLQYSDQDYFDAIKQINNFQYYYIISKIVKGINLIEDFKKNRTLNQIELKQIPLSTDMSKDWLTSTFQLFEYAIQYSSDSNNKITNTQFAKFDEYLQTKSHHRDINERIQFIPTLKDFVTENKEQFSNEKINSALEALYKEDSNNTACCGIMGSIIIYKIFPELHTIFSSNQFGVHDSIIELANKFYFSTNQSLFTQFTEQSQKILDIASYNNGRKLFNNTDYLIMVTNGFTRQQVIKEHKYISRYHERTVNNSIEKLELYELIGVQFCSDNNVNYITVSGEKMNDAVDSNSSFGKICISKNLKPMQALYKLISQEDYNKYMNKE